jgi:acetyl-CoA C-acetyltransferase
MIKNIWLIDGIRSAFGRFGGGLRNVPVTDLGVQVVERLLDRPAGQAVKPEQLLVGMAMIEGGTLVPARIIAVRAGLPLELPTLTIDRACCSGMTVAGLARNAIIGGQSCQLVLGLESMSRTPRLLHDSRWNPRRGDLVIEDLLLLRSPLSGTAIATYAGHESLERGVDRTMQDEWAMNSHARYFAAREAGYFDDEIVPVSTPDGDFDTDEMPRANVTMERLAALPTVYESPTVTPGNAPGLNDGACALLLGDDDALSATGQRPLARVHDYYQTASGPTSAVYLPGLAIRTVAERAGLSLDDLAVIEINEAFAATAVTSVRTAADGDRALEKELLARTNSNGGAVAIGHPTGASGARILLTAARRLQESGERWGVAAICGGFGQTDAVLIEAVA